MIFVDKEMDETNHMQYLTLLCACLCRVISPCPSVLHSVVVIERTRDVKELIRRDAFCWLSEKCTIRHLTINQRIQVGWCFQGGGYNTSSQLNNPTLFSRFLGIAVLWYIHATLFLGSPIPVSK